MRYTDSHEWVNEENEKFARVGVSQFAQSELGDIVYVELPIIGKKVSAGQGVAVLESTKAAADVYSPVSGTIIEINVALSKSPELINQSPEDKGWLYTIVLDNRAEIDLLMDQTAYEAMLNGA